MSPGERQLAALAAALIADKKQLTAAERELIARAPTVSVRVLAEVRGQIFAGADPLGDEFCEVRSAVKRRELGAVYTPAAIVKAMLAWADAEHVTPARVVDPGAGSGRYIIAAARKFPKAQLVAVDIDPLAALILRANASVLGFAKRLSLHLADYRALDLPAIEGPTLFIGNPPYVRHHDIGERWKTWFAATAASFKFSASKLAGLHIHFFLKTRQLAKPGDFGAFITAAEWLDVNYGSLLREMLADGLGGSAVHLINPKEQPFSGALTTGAITCFHVGNRPSQLKIREVTSLDELASLAGGRHVDWHEVRRARQWSRLVKAPAPTPDGLIELGELFRVHRGQVTGSNITWIENGNMAGVPERYLHPTITRARELINAGAELVDASRLRRVLDLPVDLDELDAYERATVERFLRLAKRHNVDQGYIASYRKAWWAVQLREPPPIFSTYMARRAPSFVLNRAGARYLNIAHGLYPRERLKHAQLKAVVAYLRSNVTTDGGRIYAGGLVKFEPKELERLKIPALHLLHADSTDSLDTGPAHSRRQNSEGKLSQ